MNSILPNSRAKLSGNVMLIAKFEDQKLEIPVENQSFSASQFAKLQFKPTTPPSQDENEKVPCRLFDPGFKNTAVCQTKISNVDPNGKLYYRGYDVEELFQDSSYLQVSYLLIFGELPGKLELDNWVQLVMTHTYLHTDIERQMLSFRHDAHPMAMLIATISSLSTFTPEANPAVQQDPLYVGVKMSNPPSIDEQKQQQKVNDYRQKFILRALGKVPTIASAVYRHRQGRNYNRPKFDCFDYCENLLFMMDKLNEPDYVPDARLVKILDKLFILLAGIHC